MQRNNAQWRVPDDTGEIFLTSLNVQNLPTAIRRIMLPEDAGGGAVIWADGDSEVVVELDRLRLALKPGLIVIELAMAEDEAGEATLVVPFRVGREPVDAVLLAVTEDLPRGNPVFSNRWGRITQTLLWEALQTVGRERWLAQTGNEQLALSGIYTDGEHLSYLFSAPASAREVADYFEQQEGVSSNFDPTPVELPKREQTGCLTAFTDWIVALGRGLLALARLSLKILRKLGALILRRD